MRLFVAIELPADVRAHLIGLRDQLKSGIGRASFTRDENLHITLKFLGEVQPERLDELTESLAHVRAGAPMMLFAEKVECFPERGPVRIVAASFGGDIAGLQSLHRSIEQRCQHMGYERETRRYRPHVTLARTRPTLPAGVRHQISASAATEMPGPKLCVSEFSLVQSHLRAEGAEYRTLRTFGVV